MPEHWKYTLALLAAGVLLVFLAAFSFTDSQLHLVFCDVGQGDAILIYHGSTQVLIDGGPDNSVLTCLSRHMPFWDRKIELVILSHAELDHYAGLVDVVRRYQIISFAGSGVGKSDAGIKILREEIEKRGVREIRVVRGQRLKVGDVELGVVWPTNEWLASSIDQYTSISTQGYRLKEGQEDKTRSSDIFRDRVLSSATVSGSANEFSVVLQLKYGEFDALLTGDIQPPVTDIVAEYAEYFDTRLHRSGWLEVLKVPHHGSKNGLTERLLESARPRLAVISVGKDNRYSHPHEEVIKLLSKQATKLLRTDVDGEIEVVTDGKIWSVR